MLGREFAVLVSEIAGAADDSRKGIAPGSSLLIEVPHPIPLTTPYAMNTVTPVFSYMRFISDGPFAYQYCVVCVCDWPPPDSVLVD